MTEIGIRELKARASEIVRAVRERHASYVVTYRGRPVGVLIPIEETQPAATGVTSEEGNIVWQELLRLGEAIGRGWKVPQTSSELLSSIRR